MSNNSRSLGSVALMSQLYIGHGKKSPYGPSPRVPRAVKHLPKVHLSISPSRPPANLFAQILGVMTT
jgi:hypothetical protein